MRMDKLTTKFQTALAEAQSMAVGRDHQFIEPAHLLLALLNQQGGTVRPLIEKAGANVSKLRSELMAALDRLPKVEGTAGEVHVSNDLSRLLNVTDKLAQQRGDEYIASELFVLAAFEDRGTLRNILRDGERRTWSGGEGDRGAARRPEGRGSERGGKPPGAREIHHRSDRAGRAGQARSGHRPRR